VDFVVLSDTVENFQRSAINVIAKEELNYGDVIGAGRMYVKTAVEEDFDVVRGSILPQNLEP
jgi:hypothetical protein